MPGFLDGSRLAFGLTEPNHGSDATFLETTAVADGGEWVVNGHKRFQLGSAPRHPRHHLRPHVGRPGVPGRHLGVPGARRLARLQRRLLLVDVQHADRPRRGHDDRRAGVEGRPVRAGRPRGSSWPSTSCTRTASARRRRRSRPRSTASDNGGLRQQADRVEQRLSTNQGIQFPLVELHTEAAMLRQLIRSTAWRLDRPSMEVYLVAMCNYRANRLACDAADRAMQTCGGVGYSRHMPFEHIYRHHRRYRITEGAGGDPDAQGRPGAVRFREEPVIATPARLLAGVLGPSPARCTSRPSATACGRSASAGVAATSAASPPPTAGVLHERVGHGPGPRRGGGGRVRGVQPGGGRAGRGVRVDARRRRQDLRRPHPGRRRPAPPPPRRFAGGPRPGQRAARPCRRAHAARGPLYSGLRSLGPGEPLADAWRRADVLRERRRARRRWQTAGFDAHRDRASPSCTGAADADLRPHEGVERRRARAAEGRLVAAAWSPTAPSPTPVVPPAKRSSR